MNLVERVKNILLTPKTEWLAIEHEPGDAAYLFRNYVAVLAAIPAIAAFIGTSLIGYSVPTVGTMRVPIVAGLLNAIITYLMSFVIAYAVAFIADALAPTFNGRRSLDQALKLVVYSYTPAWLAGIFVLIPALGFLSILGLYSLYLLWTGAAPLMKVPPERATLYTAVVVVCALVLVILLSLVQVALIGFPRA